jgi:hypothetical protein
VREDVEYGWILGLGKLGGEDDDGLDMMVRGLGMECAGLDRAMRQVGEMDSRRVGARHGLEIRFGEVVRVDGSTLPCATGWKGDVYS